VTKNPAGLIAALAIRFADGTTQVVRSGSSAKASQTGPAGWHSVDFNDEGWPAAMSLGHYGMEPWGHAGPGRSHIAPLSAGIAGKVRITYVIGPDPILACRLEPAKRYRAKLFDPVTGQLTDLGLVETDKAGEWRCAPPSGCREDWVLLLEISPGRQ
jgi:hypothetical protein